MELEHKALTRALNEGGLLGTTNDKLVQNYASIVGRTTQISLILTLDREELISAISSDEDIGNGRV